MMNDFRAAALEHGDHAHPVNVVVIENFHVLHSNCFRRVHSLLAADENYAQQLYRDHGSR